MFCPLEEGQSVCTEKANLGDFASLRVFIEVLLKRKSLLFHLTRIFIQKNTVKLRM